MTSSYASEDIRYKDLTRSLFYYQKHPVDPWIKGENFGDYLSKIVVGELARRRGFVEMTSTSHRLLAIGSIMHFAKDGDTVWGSGVNGKIDYNKLVFKSLDIRSVRGPLTQKVLRQKGVDSPDMFGDPAILLPSIFPKMEHNPIRNKVAMVPNLNEYEPCKALVPEDVDLISPLMHWHTVLDEILTSELVLTSSLHGLILSEAFGVPVRLFSPFGGETLFKYEDYLEGTGRILSTTPESFQDGVDIDKGLDFTKPLFREEDLLETFPYDLFKRGKSDD